MNRLMQYFLMLRNSILWILWRLPFWRIFASRTPVILIWHGTPRIPLFNDTICGEAFENQIIFLRKYFNVVESGKFKSRRRFWERIDVIITFDDGFRNNAEVAAPILRKYDCPATFFICESHSEGGRMLWFAYLDALRLAYDEPFIVFRGDRFAMDAENIDASIQDIRTAIVAAKPHPSAMYNIIERELPDVDGFLSSANRKMYFDGLTEKQLKDLANDPLFTIGIHTSDHPYLTLCDKGEQCGQIESNKAWIEKVTGKKPDIIAYPLGDYDCQTIRAAKHAGVKVGFAVIDKKIGFPGFELVRIGIARPSLNILGFKVQWGKFLRRMNVQFG